MLVAALGLDELLQEDVHLKVVHGELQGSAADGARRVMLVKVLVANARFAEGMPAHERERLQESLETDGAVESI